MNLPLPFNSRQWRQRLLAGFSVLAGLTALTWLGLKTSTGSPEEHLAYTRQMHDLRELDTRIDRELLLSRQELERNYDALSQYMQEAQETAARLKEVPVYLTEAQRRQVTEIAQQIETTLREKAEWVDRFKRIHSVLRNSLAFFPVAAANLLDGPQGGALKPESRRALDHYVRLVLDFSRSVDDHRRQEAAAARDQLERVELTLEQRKAMANLLRHGDVITRQLGELDRLLGQIFSLPDNTQLETLDRRYGAGHAAMLERADRYHLLLYVLAMLLAALVSWAVLHWLRAQRSLVQAHQALAARYQAQLEAEKQLKLYATAFLNAHEGITLTDAQGHILEVNPAFERITGYSRDEVIGRNPRLLKSGRQDSAFYEAMWRSIHETGHWQGEIWNRNKNGELYPELLSITTVHDGDGKLLNYVGVFIDISRLKEQERELVRMAYYDVLTDVPNRALLNDRLAQGILQTRRSGKLMAVCYVDLDGFKEVNDRWGHDAGDQLLVQVATRLKGILRGGDSVARLGGDEFALLLLGLESVEECDHAMERLLATIAQPFWLEPQRQAALTASIGVTLFPLDDSDSEMLLRHADLAMYQAKQQGKDRYHFFDIEQDQLVRRRHDSISQLSAALQREEFVLHFQPKVDMRQGTVIGAEALIRWNHPQRGLLNPSEFLPAIEHDALICSLGDWALEAALVTMERWQAAGIELPVSVNVAARQLHRDDFLARLKQTLRRHPAVASRLELEVLESAALKDVAKVAWIIEECRALGVAFALDDFGTGYSSLAYLAHLPTQTIKIDQGFVRNMLDDSNSLILVEGIVGLARALQRSVIAEGVENAEQGRLLVQLGCDLAQGYGISWPMPAEALPDWLARWQPERAWQEIRGYHWEPIDYPILGATIEHQRWIDQIIRALGEEHAPMPHQHPEDFRACHFGRWYYQPHVQKRYGGLPAFSHIEAAHRRVHAIAADIDAHWRASNQLAARRLAPELLAARDALLRELHALQLAVAVPC